jgi:hypothetical protein
MGFSGAVLAEEKRRAKAAVPGARENLRRFKRLVPIGII